MDYIGTPLDNHFWYVSYIVFSEDYLNNPGTSPYYKCYHVALIDATNTIYFTFDITSPTDLELNSLYLSISYIVLSGINCLK